MASTHYKKYKYEYNESEVIKGRWQTIQKAKIPTYKNTIPAYNTIVVGLPSQVA